MTTNLKHYKNNEGTSESRRGKYDQSKYWMYDMTQYQYQYDDDDSQQISTFTSYKPKSKRLATNKKKNNSAWLSSFTNAKISVRLFSISNIYSNRCFWFKSLD